MIKICGKEVDIDEVILGEYLDSNNYNRQTVAVECNEEMVPRAEFDNFMIRSGDVVEIVSFMGGGRYI